MQTSDFVKLLKSLSFLTEHQCKRLVNAVNDRKTGVSIPEVFESTNKSDLSCPHCGGTHIVRYGKVSQLQRYRCCTCSRTFNMLTKTPLAHLRHKELWQDFAKELISGTSIRKSAMHCGVNIKTTFLWRHRFLMLPSDRQDKTLSVIAEADETYFLHSMKGQKHLPRKARKRGGKAVKRGLSKEQVCVFVARDRFGHTFTKVMKPFNSDVLKETFKPILAKDTLLCTDGYPVYKAFARKSKILHQPLNVSAGIRVIDKTLHIQNVNAYDSRLKSWLQRFHGVASRYLPNYLGWFWMLDTKGKQIKSKNFILSAMGNTNQQLTGT